MKKLCLILSTAILFLAGCSKDNDIHDSVFIQDSEHIDLPAYSEWGYNTFGAYYDRIPFIYNDERIPAKVLVTDNSLSFILEGQKGENYYYSGIRSREMSVSFKISDTAPEQYTDLINLNNTNFDLTDPSSQLLITVDTIQYAATIISGELFFKRAQNLRIDGEQTEVILSGYFEFQALINNLPVTVSDGRFDVGIGADNFYNLSTE